MSETTSSAATRFTIHDRVLELVRGDITTQETDAIVNAANAGLGGGSGVNGAIQAAGGPAIMEETRAKHPQGCPPGCAVITGAGNLPAKHVIHAVGPVWHGGGRGEDQTLQDAYLAALKRAEENKIATIAFPSIATGVYHFPLDRAAGIALRTVINYLRHSETSLKLVRFVLFDDQTLQAYQRELQLVGEEATQTT